MTNQSRKPRANRQGKQLPRRRNPGERVVINYQTSPLSRTAHIDGAWGGVTNTGNVYAALFSEHGSIPSSMTLQIRGDGAAEEVGGDRPFEVTRQVEIELMMTEIVARAIARWLVDKADEVDAFRRMQAEAVAKDAKSDAGDATQVGETE